MAEHRPAMPALIRAPGCAPRVLPSRHHPCQETAMTRPRMKIPPLLLACLLAPLTATEFSLLDKTVVQCDELIMLKEAPRTLITAKSEKSAKTYKWSEIDMGSLPANLRDEFEAFKKEQLAKRIIIKNDKWIHRDEMLLDDDARYRYKHPLAKVGDSILEFNNTTDVVVTIGVRSGDLGYEMHIEAGKKKGYQVPNGTVTYIMAQESPDGTNLMVQKSKPVELKHMHYEVTIVTSDKIPPGELGTIPIPQEYQVKP
jgi:hypothetical protein